MSDFRVYIEAEFTIPKKRDAEIAKEQVIRMLRNSGFEEKDFIIKIDKTELIDNVKQIAQIQPSPVKIKRPYVRRKLRAVEKKGAMVKRKIGK